MRHWFRRPVNIVTRLIDHVHVHRFIRDSRLEPYVEKQERRNVHTIDSHFLERTLTIEVLLWCVIHEQVWISFFIVIIIYIIYKKERALMGTQGPGGALQVWAD